MAISDGVGENSNNGTARINFGAKVATKSAVPSALRPISHLHAASQIVTTANCSCRKGQRSTAIAGDERQGDDVIGANGGVHR